MTPDALRGHRILVVEDNALLAITLEELLTGAGAEVVGPAVTLDEAEHFASDEALSAALLDIRLEDSEVWSVADLLTARGIPFVFATGHFERETLPAEWSDRPILSKPVRPQIVLDTLAKVIGEHTSPARR